MEISGWNFVFMAVESVVYMLITLGIEFSLARAALVGACTGGHKVWPDGGREGGRGPAQTMGPIIHIGDPSNLKLQNTKHKTRNRIFQRSIFISLWKTRVEHVFLSPPAHTHP